MLNKLRNSFLIICISVTLLVLFVSFAAVYVTMSENIKFEYRLKLESAVSSAKQSFTDGIVVTSPDRNPIDSTTTNLLTFTLFIDEAGNITEKKTSLDLPDSVYDEALNIASLTPNVSETIIADKTWIFDISNAPVFEQVNEQGYAFQANTKQITFLDISSSITILNNLLMTLTVVGVITMVFVFLFSIFLSNRSIKPVKQAWDKQRQFVANASHELKTPLSVIKSNYDAILDDTTETIESQLEWFGYMKIGMYRMEKLIYSLLTLARIEDTRNNVKKESFDIVQAIRSATEPFENRVKEKDITLSCDLPQEITAHSDKSMVASIFEILFDNAVKYADKGGKINVKLWCEKRSIVLSVENSGEGIPKKELPRVFERFYRADVSRNSNTGGHGLGLAIAKEMMTTLGGKISADSRDGWTAFSVKIRC